MSRIPQGTESILCLACALLSTFCPASIPAGEPMQRGGKLVLALRSEPKTLNPLTSLDNPSREVLGRMNADLITIDRSTQLTVPALAESWSASPDGKRYTIKLRSGIRFSDGQPFDADDVIFSFQAYLDERTHSPQRDLLIINGAPVQIHKLNQYAVELDLPSTYATTERIFDGLAMLPRHLLQQSYENGTLSQAWTLNTSATAIAGLGPFRLKEYRPGDRIILERNPYYWRKGQPYLGEIEFLFAGDEDAQVARFLSGETDVMNRVSPKNAAVLRSHGFTVDDVGPSLEYNFLFFNLTPEASSPPGTWQAKKWFNQRAFREAVSLAIDRESIVKLAFAGLATPLRVHVTPGNRNWAAVPPIPPPPASPAEARKILSAANFSWDHEGLLIDSTGNRVEFTILKSNSNAEHSQMATLIQDDLKSLGITAQVVGLEFRSMVDRVLKTHDYDAAVMGLGAGDGDPNSEMNVWLSSGSMHLWNPQQQKPATAWEAEIDDLMHKQEVELDFKTRRSQYLRIQQIEAEQLPIISLVSPHVLVARSNRVRNWRPAILAHYTLWNADELFIADRRP